MNETANASATAAGPSYRRSSRLIVLLLTPFLFVGMPATIILFDFPVAASISSSPLPANSLSLPCSPTTISSQPTPPPRCPLPSPQQLAQTDVQRAHNTPKMAAAPPSQPISIGRLPHQSQSLLSANHPSNSNNPHSTPDPHLNPNSISQGAPGTSPAYSYLGADLAAHNPRWAGTSASPARNTQELSTSWNIHPGPLFVSSPHASNQQLQHQHTGGSNSNYASTSAAGFTNGSAGPSGSMNVGSYTGGGIAGTPMSISNSFYSRFQPHASSSSTSPFGGPGVINPLDPTEFKFSSSPYSRAWAGYGSYTGRSGLSGSYGRGFVGSMESDRMSILEGFYGGKGEKEAVSQ